MVAQNEPTLFSVAQQAAKNAAPVRVPLTRWERVRIWTRLVWVRWVAMGVGVLVLLSFGLMAAWPHRVAIEDWVVVTLAQTTGAMVEKIEVNGAMYTSRASLQQALNLRRGQSLITYDTFEARKKLEELPWVAKASVNRVLPKTLRVFVTEHVPMARMLQDDGMWVLSQQGQPVVMDADGRFGYLPYVEGVGAGAQAAGLFAELRSWPNLLTNLAGAKWVGERRWDLVMQSGVKVMLPAATPEYTLRDSLKILAELEDARHVLTLNDGVVDLRLNDRITLRLPETVGQTPATRAPVMQHVSDTQPTNRG